MSVSSTGGSVIVVYRRARSLTARLRITRTYFAYTTAAHWTIITGFRMYGPTVAKITQCVCVCVFGRSTPEIGRNAVVQKEQKTVSKTKDIKCEIRRTLTSRSDFSSDL